MRNVPDRVEIAPADIIRRVQVTATKSWGPTLTESVGREVDSQVAAPTETRTPNLHRAKIAQQRSADGRMATEAARLKGKKLPRGKKKHQPDTNRPSHGRTW